MNRAAPLPLIAGESVDLTAPVDAVASSQLTMSGAGKTYMTNAVDGRVRIPGNVTADWPAGLYGTQWQWQDGTATRIVSGPRYELVKPLSSQCPADLVSPDEALLAAIDAALLTTAGSGEISVSLEGFTTSFESRAELLTFRDRVARRVRRARSADNYVSKLL